MPAQSLLVRDEKLPLTGSPGKAPIFARQSKASSCVLVSRAKVLLPTVHYSYSAVPNSCRMLDFDRGDEGHGPRSSLAMGGASQSDCHYRAELDFATECVEQNARQPKTKLINQNFFLTFSLPKLLF